MDVARNALASLANVYAAVSGRGVALAAHCLWCASSLRMPALHQDGHHRYLLSLIFTFIGAFGSGTVSAYLFARPDLHPVPAFRDPRAMPFLVAAWYFVQYTYIGQRLMSVTPVRLICRLSTTLSRASRICNNSELAVSLFPGMHAAHLLMGTVGGAGGRVAGDAMKHCLGHLIVPAEVSLPGWSIRSGFLGSAIYLCFAHYLPEELQLEPQQAKALVVTICMLHSTLGVLRGADIDFTAPCAAVFHSLTGIPTHCKSAPAPPTNRTTAEEECNGTVASGDENDGNGVLLPPERKRYNLRDRRKLHRRPE